MYNDSTHTWAAGLRVVIFVNDLAMAGGLAYKF